MSQAIIVGGGAAGLGAAFRLLEKGWQVRVLEKSPHIGGLASSVDTSGTTIERFYHHHFVGQDHIVAMAERLGLSDRLHWGTTKMGFISEGELYPFNGPLDLLRFSPLPFLSRVRLGMSIAWFGVLKNWEPLDKRYAKELLLTYSGKPAWDKVWGPLLRLKYGDLLEEVSAAWIWERVHSRRKSQKLGKGKESLGYIRGGSGLLLQHLAKAVRELGGVIETGCHVEAILCEDGRCVGVQESGRKLDADAVVATVPVQVLARLAPTLPKDYIDRLANIEYQAALCVLVRLKKSLSPYYWINVADVKNTFAVIIEHTHLAPIEDYNGEVVVYLGSYLRRDHPWVTAPEDEVAKAYIADLFRLFPDLSQDDIIGYSVGREALAQPVFKRNFASIKPTLETPVQRLFLATTAQSFPESRSVNTALKLGSEAADLAERLCGANAHRP